MKETTDEILWNLCLDGNKKAFEQLYRRYYPQLHNYGYKFTTDKEIIRNTIQDLFVKIISDHKKLSPTKHVNEYLFKAFRRKLFDAIRKKNLILIDDLSLLAETAYLNEEDSAQKELFKKLYDSYKKLSAKKRQIIYLYYICKTPHEEIARILNINYQSSKNLLHRSLVQLRSDFLKSL